MHTETSYLLTDRQINTETRSTTRLATRDATAASYKQMHDATCYTRCRTRFATRDATMATHGKQDSRQS